MPNSRPPSPRSLATAGGVAAGQGMLFSHEAQVAMGSAEQYQLPPPDMLFQTLGQSEQELLARLNGDDSAFMTGELVGWPAAVCGSGSS